jgi:hypothetical protein
MSIQLFIELDVQVELEKQEQILFFVVNQSFRLWNNVKKASK